MGARLVQRSQKGVVLTTVGTALLKRIGSLQGTLRDVRQEAADLAQGRAGHLAVVPRPSVTLDTNSQAIRMTAIAHLNYLGLSPRYFLYHEARNFPLVELPVKELSFVRHISIVYRKDAYLSPAAQRLIAILKEQARQGHNAPKREVRVRNRLVS